MTNDRHRHDYPSRKEMAERQEINTFESNHDDKTYRQPRPNQTITVILRMPVGAEQRQHR